MATTMYMHGSCTHTYVAIHIGCCLIIIYEHYFLTKKFQQSDHTESVRVLLHKLIMLIYYLFCVGVHISWWQDNWEGLAALDTPMAGLFLRILYSDGESLLIRFYRDGTYLTSKNVSLYNESSTNLPPLT